MKRSSCGGRQRVGAVEAGGRVLRRDHRERPRQRVRLPFDRDLQLGHRLEQPGLRFRRRPVQLVDQDDVGEDRPRVELEGLRAGRARSSSPARRWAAGRRCPGSRAKRPSIAGGEGAGQLRLADPRPVLEQQVAARQQRAEHHLEHLPVQLHPARDALGQVFTPCGDAGIGKPNGTQSRHRTSIADGPSRAGETRAAGSI